MQIKTSNDPPKVLIFSGEPVVNIRGNGKGGRNQHLALLMAKKLSGFKNICFLSLASDGSDGPTDAAGGFVDGKTWKKMIDIGSDPEMALLNFDSYSSWYRINPPNPEGMFILLSAIII